jgi:ribonuclease HI
MTEYEAYIFELKVVLELKIKKLDVYEDSMLIIYHVKGEWQIKRCEVEAISRIFVQTSKII